jgi:hypothetical protein
VCTPGALCYSGFMEWQDVVFGVGSILFILALLPALIKREGPPLSTCLLTGSVLLVFSLKYLSLDLRFAAVTAFLSAALWLGLAVQKLPPLPLSNRG